VPNSLFVVMPFGKHGLRDIEQDFDLVYQDLVRPAADQAGWSAHRIDEVTATGNVPNQYLRELLQADLVLADISAPNGNVFYEVGIRHAISPTGILFIASRGTIPPFDLQHERILFYDPNPTTGTDRDVGKLAAFLKQFAQNKGESPVYTFYQRLGLVSNPGWDSDAFASEFNSKIERASNYEQLMAVWYWARQFTTLPISASLMLARKLAGFQAYAEAAQVLQLLILRGTEDFEVHRQLGYYLSKVDSEASDAAAEDAFRHALELNPADPETIGMLGGLLKRQSRYEEAREAYDRGARLAPSNTYMRVNQAAVAVLAAPAGTRDTAYYAELLDWLPPEGDSTDYWTELVRGEAYFAVGRDVDARATFERALALRADPEALRSAARQLRLFAENDFRADSAESLAEYLFTSASMKIHLSTTTRPENVRPENALESKPISTIFHLSDLHFGSVQAGGDLIQMHRFYDSENTRRLSLELEDEISRALANRGVSAAEATIVITGDLTYTGSPSEFREVRQFLEELCRLTGIPRQRVFIVPGNHDVSWDLARADLSHRFDGYLGFLARFYDDNTFRSRYPFLSEWDMRLDEDRPHPSEIVAWWLDGHVLYVGLNSCVYEDDQNHYGFVGIKQLRRLSQEINSLSAGEGTIRVAALHHHLHPFPETLNLRSGPDVYLDMSTVRDAGAVERRLEMYGFDFVLHGHKHKPQLRETLLRDRRAEGGEEWKRLIVSGCGSTGVAERELSHEVGNHYAIIDILRTARQTTVDFAAVEWRELSLEDDSEWATIRRWMLRG
jgi:predicted MPP superfamily phosphohydrolase